MSLCPFINGESFIHLLIVLCHEDKIFQPESILTAYCCYVGNILQGNTVNFGQVKSSHLNGFANAFLGTLCVCTLKYKIGRSELAFKLCSVERFPVILFLVVTLR